MKKTFSPQTGFTLVELLVSTAIISLLMLILVSMTNQTSDVWQKTTEKVEKFEEARDAFESMTRQISQATLNTYWTYLDKTGLPRGTDVQSTAYKQFVPVTYGRASELRFLSGPMSVFMGDSIHPTHGVFFAAPLGDATTTLYQPLDNLLNVFGYYVEVGTEDSRPSFITDAISPLRTRSRLKEFRQPTENMGLYEMQVPSPTAADSNNTYDWFKPTLSTYSRVLAENVIALIILPKLSKEDQDARSGALPLCPLYKYDSTKTKNDGGSGTDPVVNPHNQLPPIVQVTMVAIDERSAQRFVDLNGGNKNFSKNYFGTKDPSSFFQNSANFDTVGSGELATYEQQLVRDGMTYRIFSMNVSVRGAKWSRSQTN